MIMPKVELRTNKTKDKYAIVGDREAVLTIWDMARLLLSLTRDEDGDNIDNH